MIFGQTVPCLRTTTVTCSAPCSRAVLAFSMAKAPMPTTTTRLPRQSTCERLSLVPVVTVPWKDSSPGQWQARGTPTRSLMASRAPREVMTRVPEPCVSVMMA